MLVGLLVVIDLVNEITLANMLVLLLVVGQMQQAAESVERLVGV